jgi:hypothetical protein
MCDALYALPPPTTNSSHWLDGVVTLSKSVFLHTGKKKI